MMRQNGRMWTMRILAIDDDPVFLGLLAGMLGMIGYSDVTVLPSGPSALLELDRPGQTWDCILCDLQMPDLDGATLTALIRQNPAYRQTPILMVTALSGKSAVDDAFAAGATDYITKPLDIIELRARMGVVEHLLSERNPAGKPAGLNATRDSRAEFDTAVMIPGFDRGNEYLAMENYLLTLGPKRAYATTAIAIHIRNASLICNRATGAAFTQMLCDVGNQIIDALGTESMIAYAGRGTFVCLLNRDIGQTPQGLELLINHGLTDFEPVYLADRLPVPQVRVGDPARSAFLSPGHPTRILDRAIHSAQSPPDGRAGKGRLVA